MLRTALVVCPLVLFGVISCGDSSSDVSSGTAGTAGTSANAGENPGGSPGETAGTSSSGNTTSGGTNSMGGADMTPGGEGGMSSTNGGAPDSMAGAAGAGGAAAANCADIFGDYTIKSKAGMCDSLDKNAPQSIQGNDVTCVAHFVSVPAKLTDPAAINGATPVDAKGGFTKAKLTLDKTLSSPCEGTWTEMSKTMTVKCGNPGSLCTVVMTKQ
jgi:hypothetical protein